jgi:AcrR family transcriptional regulator
VEGRVTQGSTRRETTDGRLLRSQRSRELIADALYELVGEGHLEPTAQQAADRAGVGIRTVFRLFSDMESLYATMNARLLAEVGPMLREGPPEGVDLGERATALVADRAALFERVAPYMRSTKRHRSHSPFLEDQHRKIVRQLRARLLRWLPELRDAPLDLVEALDQAASFEAWDRLRSDQRLGRPRARAAMERAVMALVHELEDGR